MSVSEAPEGREIRTSRAERVAAALGGYLRDRFDLPSAEPTPAEVSAWLARLGLPAGQVERAARLLAQCAALRFRPEEAAGDVASAARAWVISVEEASCPPS